MVSRSYSCEEAGCDHKYCSDVRASSKLDVAATQFEAQTGVTLSVFLDEQRMARAAALLRSTNTRIKEITHALGHSHEPSFARAFKRRFECILCVYRIQYRTLLRADLSPRERNRVLAVWNSVSSKMLTNSIIC